MREKVDYGVAFEPTGRIRFRAEHYNHWAVDGQAGCILRTYREHQMSPDDAFLRRIRHKVEVNAPTRDVYERIFYNYARKLGMQPLPEAITIDGCGSNRPSASG